MHRSKFIHYIVAGVAFLSVVLVNTTDMAFAQSSELRQEIILAECNYDTYLAGIGFVHDIACPYFAPVISYFERTANGRFKVYGAYDAIHTAIDPTTGKHRLVVLFAGRSYQLGVHPELTVDGNAWVLDVADWREDPVDEQGSDASLPTQSVIKVRSTSVMLPRDGSAKGQSLSDESTITAPNRQMGMTEITQEPLASDDDCQPTDTAHINPWLLVGILAALLVETVVLWMILLGRRRHKQAERLAPPQESEPSS